MDARKAVAVICGVIVVGALSYPTVAQEGVGEKVGGTLDKVGRGIRHEAQVIGEGVRTRFDSMKGDVHDMSVQSRVYSRIHWDRVLNSAKIEVHVIRNGVVVLRGSVPDQAARDRAAVLTRDTLGVTEVFDELVPLSGSTGPVSRAR